MYLMFKRSPRYILMIVIMAVGMMMSSMGTFASHGTNGLTGYEMNLHDAEVTMTVQDHSHDSDIPQSGHAGHHQTDHFHETPQQPPSVEITENTPLLAAIKLVRASLEQSSAKKRTGFRSGVSSSCS